MTKMPQTFSNGTTKPEMTHLQPKTTLSQLQTIMFFKAFSMPSGGTESPKKLSSYEAMSIEERLTEATSKPLSEPLPSPKPTFTITALVAPTTTEINVKSWYFGPTEVPAITETITFDIDADKFPESIRCSCLAAEHICTAEKTKAHYLIEWQTGSVLATGESSDFSADGDGNADIKKEGRPRIYKGWCKNSERIDISETERLCCIEALEEHVAEVEERKKEVLRREGRGWWARGWGFW